MHLRCCSFLFLHVLGFWFRCISKHLPAYKWIGHIDGYMELDTTKRRKLRQIEKERFDFYEKIFFGDRFHFM